MFYPDNPLELRQLIDQSFRNARFGPGRQPPLVEKRRIFGIVSPHAGYVYSGSVAANGFLEVSSLDFEDVIMVGPNHYGIGKGVAIMRDGVWETPLGEVQINSELAQAIANKSALTDFSDVSHSKDHCLEVQVPFLQYLDKQFRIVPIVLIMQDIDTALDLGRAIADAVTEKGLDRTLLVASSDLTHYEPNADAHRKDSELIKAVLALDVHKFYAILERLDVSACGYGAIASIMVAAKYLGATRGDLLRYATSGDVTGDNGPVVGYSSIVFV
jgi:AmmeMemoRadiSam system protein B